MKKFSSLILVACNLISLSAWAIPQPTRLELDPAYIAQIQALFPESTPVHPRLIDFRVDPNLHLFREAEIHITFIHEGAGYQNSFGYFLFEDADRDGNIVEAEIERRELLFPNASMEGSGGDLRTGDTVSLGRFPAGTKVGFFLVANGALNPTETYFTLDGLNSDGRHLAMLAMPDRESVILGIEDLPLSRSDRDFNDLLFTFTTDPKSALQEVIDDSEIPVATEPPSSPSAIESPAPAVTATPNEVVFQQAKAPAMLEGGGLGCQLGASGTSRGLSLIFHGMLILLIFGFWERNASAMKESVRDIYHGVFSMDELRRWPRYCFTLDKSFRQRRVPPSKWLDGV